MTVLPFSLPCPAQHMFPNDNSPKMEDNDVLRSSSPSRLPSGENSNDLQTLVHAAVMSTKRIKGINPIIVPVTKSSPVGLYANLDLKASVHENPWDIIQSITRRQPNFVEFCFPPASKKHGNIRRSQQQSRQRHARITKRLHTHSYNVQRTGLPPTKQNPAHSVDSHHHLIIFGADAASRSSRAPNDKSILALQGAPRAPKFRKLYMRAFSYEIQNIMHGFGEVRYCSTNVLEFVESSVRNVTQRVALGILSRFNTEKLTVCNISTCIHRDPNALYRLLFCLHKAALHGKDLQVVRPVHREWDSFLHHATIHGIKVEDFPSLNILERIPVVKMHNKCTELARSLYWNVFGSFFKLQHKQSVQSSLTDPKCRYPSKDIRDRRRIDLFREWLALPDYVQMTEGSLHALGNLTREAIGVITQTALVLRHRNESFQSYEQLLVIAIGYGIGAGVMLPLSGMQIFELHSNIEEMESRTREKLQGAIRAGQKLEGLTINYIREAWRQLDDPEALAAHRSFWFGM